MRVNREIRRSRILGMGCGGWGLGRRVSGLGFRVWGQGFGAWISDELDAVFRVGASDGFCSVLLLPPDPCPLILYR